MQLHQLQHHEVSVWHPCCVPLGASSGTGDLRHAIDRRRCTPLTIWPSTIPRCSSDWIACSRGHGLSAGEGNSERTRSGTEAELPSTPAPAPWTSCTPESVRRCYPALQYDTARQPSRHMGVQKTSHTSHGHE